MLSGNWMQGSFVVRKRPRSLKYGKRKVWKIVVFFLSGLYSPSGCLKSYIYLPSLSTSFVFPSSSCPFSVYFFLHCAIFPSLISLQLTFFTCFLSFLCPLNIVLRPLFLSSLPSLCPTSIFSFLILTDLHAFLFVTVFFVPYNPFYLLPSPYFTFLLFFRMSFFIYGFMFKVSLQYKYLT